MLFERTRSSVYRAPARLPHPPVHAPETDGRRPFPVPAESAAAPECCGLSGQAVLLPSLPLLLPCAAGQRSPSGVGRQRTTWAPSLAPNSNGSGSEMNFQERDYDGCDARADPRTRSKRLSGYELNTIDGRVRSRGRSSALRREQAARDSWLFLLCWWPLGSE
jgi:hypothetical protein